MMDNRRIFRMTVASDDVQAFLDSCEESEWYAYDTGERVMTDDGPDAEAVLLVEPAARAASAQRAALVH